VRLSLRARLIVVPAAIVVGAVGLVAALEQRSQRNWLIERETASLLRLAREAARGAAPDSGSWQPAADSLDARFGLRTTVIAADGAVLADSRATAATMENHAGRDEVRRALAGEGGAAVRRSRTVGEEFLYAAVPMPRDGAAVLRLAQPLVEVRRMADSLTRLSAAAAAIALLASVLVLAALGSRLAERLRRLQALARRIGRGEPGARAPEDPGDDLGQLGRALNEMRAELDARVETLRRERDDRERILAHMNEGVALLDGADRVVHVNHRFAELLHAVRPPDPGTPFAAFTRTPELVEMVASARGSGRTESRDLKPWTTRLGTARVTVTPLGGPAPEPVLVVLHDLSQSEALQRIRQDFVANVSHELRTPLTSLRGYAETLLEGALDDPEAREHFVRVIRDGAIRLQELVEDLLVLAEMERPDVSLRRERLDLGEVAGRIVAGARDVALRTGLALQLEPGPPVWVDADRVRLEQAMSNLLDNALKYTERGSVTVRVGGTPGVAGSGGSAWFEVRDTGPGIPEADLPRIFERFYRVDKARSRESGPARGGTGLGLSIVKHAVQLHGGEVSVQSRPGAGSTFRFSIPVRPAPTEG
jgi:two-component system phosphate regulon sensor histidine kinase PhoR